MYTNLFGNYLLDCEAVDRDMILTALKECSPSDKIPPFIGMYMGYLTSEETSAVRKKAEESGENFYDLCAKLNYMSREDADRILNEPQPHFMYIAQHLLDHKAVEPEKMIQLVAGYSSQYEIIDLEFQPELNNAMEQLIVSFASLNLSQHTDLAIDYFLMLINDLLRYIGDDFTPLSMDLFSGFLSKICASQNILGETPMFTSIDMDEDTAIKFASRFSGVEFNECDEYVEAALCDFLNQHNGLYIVNESNNKNRELSLDAPINQNYDLLPEGDDAFLLNLKFDFGFVNFYIVIG